MERKIQRYGKARKTNTAEFNGLSEAEKRHFHTRARGSREGRSAAQAGGSWAEVVRGAIEVCRLEAREPAGVRLRGRGDAVCAEKVAIGTEVYALPWTIAPTASELFSPVDCPRFVGSLTGCSRKVPPKSQLNLRKKAFFPRQKGASLTLSADLKVGRQRIIATRNEA
jgi:hypothetical protein